MTDKDRQWAALLKAMQRPSDYEHEDRIEAKLAVRFVLLRESFDTFGPALCLNAMRLAFIEQIDNAIEKVREAVK